MSTGLCVLKRPPRQSFSDPRRSGLNGGHGKTVLAHSIILSLVLWWGGVWYYSEKKKQNKFLIYFVYCWTNSPNTISEFPERFHVTVSMYWFNLLQNVGKNQIVLIAFRSDGALLNFFLLSDIVRCYCFDNLLESDLIFYQSLVTCHNIW